MASTGRAEIVSWRAFGTVSKVTGTPALLPLAVEAVDPNAWGVRGDRDDDPSRFDVARLNLFFPAGTILSDALTQPPDPSGATVQFGLFLRDLPAPEEAFVVVALQSVPEPGAGGTAAALVVGALAARRRSLDVARGRDTNLASARAHARRRDP